MPETMYIWDPPVDTCELAFMCLSTGMEVVSSNGDNVFMSMDGGLICLVKLNAISICNQVVYQTNYEGIYLYSPTEVQQFTRKVEAGEMSISTYVKNWDNYMFNHLVDEIK
jgi:hypothetical protein